MSRFQKPFLVGLALMFFSGKLDILPFVLYCVYVIYTIGLSRLPHDVAYGGFPEEFV